MPKIDAKIRRFFHRGLAAWYQTAQRDLPWRRNPEPYAVTVSEFMCQQTQIATVLPYFERWLAAFPDWKALAGAPESRVLKLWEGLGYYNRARNLQRLARVIDRDFSGSMPSDPAALLKLPGIGPYTAGAIASIAFGRRAAVLDGNVERVLTRVFDLDWNVSRPDSKRRLWQLAAALLPEEEAGNHNQALMELGALICSPRSPQCLLCPLKTICRSQNPESRPVKSRAVTTREYEQIALLQKPGKIWFLKPGRTGRWKGFYRLPLLDESTMQARVSLGRITYSITRYRVQSEIVAARWKRKAAPGGIWLTPSQTEKLALPAPHRKVLQMSPGLLNQTTF